MKRHTRYAGSGIKLTLLLIALGCLLAGGLASAIFQPTSAAQDDSLRLNPKTGHSTPDSVSRSTTFVEDMTKAMHPLAEDQSGKFFASPYPSGHVIELDGDGTVCRDATEEEARAMQQRDPEPQLRAINDEESSALSRAQSPSQSVDGLKIILRGTPQLEQNPAAKVAFIRAAQRWEAVIQSPITLVIDVDFGPTRFGQPYSGELGSTGTQEIGSDTGYPSFRTALIGRASSAQESALYNSLPQSQLPTDIGATTAMLGPAAVFRALGIINPVANPEGEREQLGPPPSVGFNSAHQFDFDPSDGIEPGKFDFDAVATHEIGHALGFDSNAGLKEMFPTTPVAPSPWDLFRFRPGVTSGSFSTAQRIQSSGGEQVFFGGGLGLAVSTGRPDGSGGDGRNPSHWQDDDLAGRYIGIMDPRIPAGQRQEITENDLKALDLMGYQLKSNPNPNPTPTPPLNQQVVELKVDDGSVDAGALLNGLMIVNRLTPPSYPATLQKIRFIFPRFQNQPDPTGKPVTVVVFADPGGAGQPPAGAQIGRLNTTVPGASPTDFFELILPNGPTISSGDFYIGFQAPSPHQGVGFGIDTSGQSPNRSFFSIDDGASFASLAPVLQVNSANALIRAVVSTGGSTPTPTPNPTPTPGPGGNTVALTSGAPQTGSIPAPQQPGGGVLGETQYTIRVPTGATQLKVDLSGNPDIDLFVRYGNRIAIQNGAIVSDFKSESATGNESITITPGSSPALQAGLYYIAVGNFGPGAANFTVTATVPGGPSPTPTPTPTPTPNPTPSPGGNTVALTSGAPQTGAIPAPQQPGAGV
ncbi:MAG: NF038122 family metalloprotease, partial [Blastocatellia bacterium]